MSHNSNYELFLPAIAAAIRSKVREDKQLSDSEFRAVVATVFQDAVLQFMRDTHLHQATIPIDVYEGVSDYEIKAPDGYMIEDLIDVLGNKVVPNDFYYDNDRITLIDCCPTSDLHQAFYVKVALVPLRQTCEFDNLFLNKYYDSILALMLYKLYSMVGREWKSIEQSAYVYNQYMDTVARERREMLMKQLVAVGNEDKASYLQLLPSIASYIFTQRRGERSEMLSLTEFKQIIATTYRQAVIRVMRDTQLYRVQIPIDFYAGTVDYDIVAPDGFVVEEVIQLMDGKIRVPNLRNTDDQIFLNKCPKADIPLAIYANVALVPTSHGSICKFDKDFVDRYRDLIFEAMLIDLHGMTMREWHNPELMDYHRRNYESLVSKVSTKSAFNEAMDVSGNPFNLLLRTMMASLYRPEGNLSQSEFKQMIQSSYEVALARVMRDTKFYRSFIPVDIYEGVQDYDLQAPDGYRINEVIELQEHKGKLPKHQVVKNTITLTCCPNRSLHEAFYAEVALTPKISDLSCDIDPDFIDKHYDLIRYAMLSELHSMTERYWYDPGQAARNENLLKKAIVSSRRREAGYGSVVKYKTKRLSDYATLPSSANSGCC